MMKWLAKITGNPLSFAKTLRGHKSRRVTMLQDHPHAIHFKHILYFGENCPGISKFGGQNGAVSGTYDEAGAEVRMAILHQAGLALVGQ